MNLMSIDSSSCSPRDKHFTISMPNSIMIHFLAKFLRVLSDQQTLLLFLFLSLSPPSSLSFVRALLKVIFGVDCTPVACDIKRVKEQFAKCCLYEQTICLPLACFCRVFCFCKYFNIKTPLNTYKYMLICM